MTPEEIRIVRSDWRTIEPLGDIVSTIFYANLFDLDPTLRRLFGEDLSDQKTKLHKMLSIVVDKLDKPETLEPIVRRLGTRHAHYGVLPEHYATVGSALLDTLRTGIGQTFDASHEAAWSRAYGQLVVWMLGKA